MIGTDYMPRIHVKHYHGGHLIECDCGWADHQHLAGDATDTAVAHNFQAHRNRYVVTHRYF